MLPNSRLPKFFSLAAVAAAAFLASLPGESACGHALSRAGETRAARDLSILPTPRVVRFHGEWLPLAGAAVAVYAAAGVAPASGRLGPAADALVRARLAALDAGDGTEPAVRARAAVTMRKVPPARLERAIAQLDASATLGPKALEQAYVIETVPSAEGAARLTVAACTDLGLHYACVTACQLLDNNRSGDVVVPVVRIADWPAIGLRLAKASASMSSLERLRECARWLPSCKLNLMGLQYHGDDSKRPGGFLDNVAAVSSDARASGILETVVYFCPFRGSAERSYDFSEEADRGAYASRLQWFLAQGARGIEVDYNDWPSLQAPIEDVLNLACEALADGYPDAYVLHCPPLRGDSQYRGPASPEMKRILASVPEKVWPLWTGPATLITQPLASNEIEAWTEAAGRRPFLWVNRASPNAQFSRTVAEVPGSQVFRGELLPRNLGDLVEGVHLNTAITHGSDGRPGVPAISAEAKAYLATAGDFLWNPTAWDAVRSARNARRLVSIMQPLLPSGD